MQPCLADEKYFLNRVLNLFEMKNNLLEILQVRFEQNMARHQGLAWSQILAKLEAQPAKLQVLSKMEATGGEPDVLIFGPKKELFFVDCSPESPKGRRSLCYDRLAWESRKEHRPISNALDLAKTMGVEILDEEQYRILQEFGDFDQKTSSWLLTPSKIRNLGGAIFADKRYDEVFIYHNGADSYYASRGFRALLKL